jgi:hypothetical protein
MAGSCNLEPLAIEDPGTMTEYRGNNGISYSIRLTGDDTGAVWGGLNGYYTDDSDVSTAAVHAGVINVNETDVIVVIIRPGRDEYFGSSANGITTGDWGSWSGSFEFE